MMAFRIWGPSEHEEATEPSDATEREWRSDFPQHQDHLRHFRPLIASVLCLDYLYD